jgi:hypothetical protein
MGLALSQCLSSLLDEANFHLGQRTRRIMERDGYLDEFGGPQASLSPVEK